MHAALRPLASLLSTFPVAGPRDTPYEGGYFVIDIQLGEAHSVTPVQPGEALACFGYKLHAATANLASPGGSHMRHCPMRMDTKVWHACARAQMISTHLCRPRCASGARCGTPT